MKKINQLGVNQFEKGKRYLFDVLELKNDGEMGEFILLKFNNQFYTVEPLRSQLNKKLPSELKCYVEDIVDGKVVLRQKERNKILLPLLLGVVIAIGLGVAYSSYNVAVSGKVVDIDNENAGSSASQPKIENEQIKTPSITAAETESHADMEQFHLGEANEIDSGDSSENFNKKILVSSVNNLQQDMVSYNVDSFKRTLESTGQITPIGIHYEKENYYLSQEAKTLINEFVKTCEELDKDGVFMVEGYTCDLGSDMFNLSLSERRALAVKDFVETIKGDNDVKIGFFGESKFFNSGSLEESRVLNRVSFVTFNLIDEK